MNYRTPLFPVSLAFAAGCIIAFATSCSQPLAVVLFLIGLVVFTIFQRVYPSSSLPCLLLIFTGGLLHTVTVSLQIPANDVRKLPEQERNSPLADWIAVVRDEPSVSPPEGPRSKVYHEACTLWISARHAADFAPCPRTPPPCPIGVPLPAQSKPGSRWWEHRFRSATLYCSPVRFD